MAETPDSVLAQELWLAAASSDQWWRQTQVVNFVLHFCLKLDYIILYSVTIHLGYNPILCCDVDDWLHPWPRG